MGRVTDEMQAGLLRLPTILSTGTHRLAGTQPEGWCIITADKLDGTLSLKGQLNNDSTMLVSPVHAQ